MTTCRNMRETGSYNLKAKIHQRLDPVAANSFWSNVNQLVMGRSANIIYAIKRDAIDLAETIRFTNPAFVRIYRIPASSIEQILDSVEADNAVAFPDATWALLRKRFFKRPSEGRQHSSN